MKLITISFRIFVYGVYSDLKTKRLNNIVAKKINSGEPVCGMRIVNMSNNCYRIKRKIFFLEKRFKTEIEKKKNM